ncbi:unnamed protein product [Acanthoscelides obtectus]|uniref:Uncharacterized protein n=1 Tax=Acanthoscelides obtectus TaxID=200917 RepID=A0A9P0PTC5_ACAOB|nr:unnamed protein product [Acanthoscelides obtectus]CAK1660022.1 hypothetical protein AOBTE_LOCUS21821 [Acanthoscelides obtectus]
MTKKGSSSSSDCNQDSSRLPSVQPRPRQRRERKNRKRWYVPPRMSDLKQKTQTPTATPRGTDPTGMCNPQMPMIHMSFTWLLNI